MACGKAKNDRKHRKHYCADCCKWKDVDCVKTCLETQNTTRNCEWEPCESGEEECSEESGDE